MFNRLSLWIVRISSGWVVLISVLIMILFMVFVLPNQAEQSKEYSGFSPDTTFLYHPTKLISAAEAYGPEGRQAYIHSRWTFDLVFPLVYVGFLAVGISWFLNQHDNRKIGHLNLLPLAAGVFDYLENTATTVVMAIYPKVSYLTAYLASGFTLVKWIFVYASFGVYFIAFFVYFIPLFKAIKKQQ